jgi:2,3-bisphosphoglycerate-dependent phosphoglycerate mutase
LLPRGDTSPSQKGLDRSAMNTLVLIRHGRTEWAAQNRFAGWADAPLADSGKEEALRAAKALKERGFTFDLAQTSYLSRARETLDLILEAMDLQAIPREETWRLNERHYGALQGQNRTKAAMLYGNDQLARWRRDYRARPPAQPGDAPDHPRRDPRYADVDAALLPDSESLEDAALRVLPWWEERLAPLLRQGRRVLVVAHTASIRGLTRHIEDLSDAEAEAFRIATCLPLVYRFDSELNVVEREEVASGLSSKMRRLLAKHKPGKAISWV